MLQILANSPPAPNSGGAEPKKGFHVPQDPVGERLVGGIAHLGMNSKAHSENPLKRVQEIFDVFS
jgi:hypothetical protein